MPLLPYPDTMQLTEAITVMLKPLQGGAINTHEEVHAAWIVLGFAGGQLLPDAPKIAAMPKGVIDDLIIKWLSNVDWAKVAEYVMKLIMDWLSKKTGNGPKPLPPFDPPVEG